MTPENETQPATGSQADPGAGSAAGSDPAPRPSDSEAAHRPEEGSSVRTGEGSPSFAPDAGHGGSGRDRKTDYGSATANAGDGTGDLTAGPAVADALPPDAVAERADIAADDVGASAFAQAADEEARARSRNATGAAAPRSGALPSGGQGREVDPGVG